MTVYNPGTGDAENVSVRFASGANPPETITVGTILAGQQKQIEVQIAASQSGKIAISTDKTNRNRATMPQASHAATWDST